MSSNRKHSVRWQNSRLNFARHLNSMADNGDVIRRITVQATGEGIDSTTNSVTGLGDAIDNTSKKAGSLFSEMATSVVGVGAAIGGSLAAMRAFIDLVGEQADKLAQLSEHAGIASMSAREFQQTMYAAMS